MRLENVDDLLVKAVQIVKQILIQSFACNNFAT
jgi:hypothetical protein